MDALGRVLSGPGDSCEANCHGHGTCVERHCECDPYWLQDGDCAVNYADVVGWRYWAMAGTAMALHGCISAAMLYACVRRRRGRACCSPPPGDGGGLIPGCPCLTWRATVETLTLLGSLGRVLFLLPPRQDITSTTDIAVANITLRIPQVMWICAYLCVVVVWFDLVAFLRRRATGSRKRAPPGRRLKVAVRVVVLGLLAVEVALEVLATLHFRIVGGLANLLLGVVVLVMVGCGAVFSARVLRALQYVADVSDSAAPAPGAGGLRHARAASAGTAPPGGLAAAQAALAAQAPPHLRSGNPRSVGGSASTPSAASVTARAAGLFFGEDSDGSVGSGASGSTGSSARSGPPAEGSGSGPIRVERDAGGSVPEGLGTGLVGGGPRPPAPGSLALGPQRSASFLSALSVWSGAPGGGGGAAPGAEDSGTSPLLARRPSGGASVLPDPHLGRGGVASWGGAARPTRQRSTGGERAAGAASSAAACNAARLCCRAGALMGSADPLLQLLARISVTTVMALVIAGVLLPTTVAMFAVPVDSKHNPWGFLAVQCVVYVFVECGACLFLTLAIWPANHAPHSRKGSGSAASVTDSATSSAAGSVAGGSPPRRVGPRGWGAASPSAPRGMLGVSLPPVHSSDSVTGPSSLDTRPGELGAANRPPPPSSRASSAASRGGLTLGTSLSSAGSVTTGSQRRRAARHK